MVATHYRWDFIGLSTDTKPTPETSEKVVDGSTFYCSDNSKLYVWCKNQWYEKEVSGGGGTTYTAGDGIDITNSTISVDTNTIQPKLTAGSNVTISDNTISATDTTYNNFTGTDGNTGGTAGLVPAPATTDAGKFLKADGTWDTAGGGSAPIRFLTEDDYNYTYIGSPYVAVWLLQDGVYVINPYLNTMLTTSGTFGYTSITPYSSLICVSTQKNSSYRLVCVLGNGSGGYNSKLQVAYTIKLNTDGGIVGTDYNGATS